MGRAYVLDDTFKISEEVMNMSDEEMERQINILEEQGRCEREKIANRRDLLINRERG